MAKREVFYFKYCPTCDYYHDDVDRTDVEVPCHECLNNPYNYDSHKPINYKCTDESKIDVKE